MCFYACWHNWKAFPVRSIKPRCSPWGDKRLKAFPLCSHGWGRSMGGVPRAFDWARMFPRAEQEDWWRSQCVHLSPGVPTGEAGARPRWRIDRRVGKPHWIGRARWLCFWLLANSVASLDLIRAVHASLAKFLVFGLLVAFGGRDFGTFEGGIRRELWILWVSASGVGGIGFVRGWGGHTFVGFISSNLDNLGSKLGQFSSVSEGGEAWATD